MEPLPNDWQNVIDYCAQECKRQKSGEEGVSGMIAAYSYMVESSRSLGSPSPFLIQELAYFVEPVKNYSGFRTSPVTINHVAIPAHDILRRVTLLCDAWDNLVPQVWYHEFEKIHPFRDGNGRVGSLLYNWRRGELHLPVAPPDVFALDKTIDTV